MQKVEMQRGTEGGKDYVPIMFHNSHYLGVKVMVMLFSQHHDTLDMQVDYRTRYAVQDGKATQTASIGVLGANVIPGIKFSKVKPSHASVTEESDPVGLGNLFTPDVWDSAAERVLDEVFGKVHSLREAINTHPDPDFIMADHEQVAEVMTVWVMRAMAESLDAFIKQAPIPDDRLDEFKALYAKWANWGKPVASVSQLQPKEHATPADMLADTVGKDAEADMMMDSAKENLGKHHPDGSDVKIEFADDNKPAPASLGQVLPFNPLKK